MVARDAPDDRGRVVLPVEDVLRKEFPAPDVIGRGVRLAVPSHVDDDGLPGKADFPAGLPDPQAEVLLFPVQEEALVEPADVPDDPGVFG